MEDNKGGRPLKWNNVEELQKQIDKYFNDTPKEEYSITGLALALDTDRSVLCDYQERDEFSHAIKKAKNRIENAYELRLIKRGSSGDIFALKNFGWKDKTEVDQNIGNKDDKPFEVDLKQFTIDQLKELIKNEDKE